MTETFCSMAALSKKSSLTCRYTRVGLEVL